MTKQTGLHLEYCSIRRRYAVIVIGGGRSPWKGVRRADAVCVDVSQMPCIQRKQDQRVCLQRTAEGTWPKLTAISRT